MTQIMIISSKSCNLLMTTATTDASISRKIAIIKQTPAQLNSFFGQWLFGKLHLCRKAGRIRNGYNSSSFVIKFSTGFYSKKNYECSYQKQYGVAVAQSEITQFDFFAVGFLFAQFLFRLNSFFFCCFTWFGGNACFLGCECLRNNVIHF